VLVLLMGVICEVCRSDGPRWHDIHTKSHDDWFRHLSNIKGIISTISDAIMLVSLIFFSQVCQVEGFMIYATEIAIVAWHARTHTRARTHAHTHTHIKFHKIGTCV
jgi:uncharacterized protein involved in cysteine biosynthesis